jgi:RNA polymerase I-specific transcription initiation factor RRN5
VKCDRKSPCTQCAKSKTHCVYPTIPPVPSKPVNGPEEFSDHRSDVEALASENGEFRILQAIPEADLLCPDTMLTLSRELFMNRSAEFSSPWPHWSHYISELATEPSIYRTALNDLHRLVVSLTRRLVQTTIIQATSRLRAQRLRKEKKGLLPFVKLKDVYAAIDILGMKRNGSERWRGVPRRCGLKVVTSRKTPRGKSTREVPWSEIEGIMGSVAMPDEQAASEAEASAESNNFQSRAIRSGTPLPMHGLTLSDSEGELRSVGTTDDSGDSDDSDFSEHFVADKLQSSVRHDFQPRDHIGRYTSALSKRTNDEAPKYLNTLEEFDQEASRLEESMLWDTLSMQPAANSDLKIDERVKDDDSDIHDKVTTTSNNWRQTLDYRASWEKYKTSVSVAKLITNQQPSNHALFNFGTRTWTIAPSVAGISDASITRNTEGRRERSRTEIELQARGTNAYAALQREVLESSSQGFGSSSSGNDRALPEQDIPAESVEA